MYKARDMALMSKLVIVLSQISFSREEFIHLVPDSDFFLNGWQSAGISPPSYQESSSFTGLYWSLSIYTWSCPHFHPQKDPRLQICHMKIVSRSLSLFAFCFFPPHKRVSRFTLDHVTCSTFLFPFSGHSLG